MPLTFVEIERQKSWKIVIFFLILLFMYLCIALLLVITIVLIFSIPSSKGFILFGGNLGYTLKLLALALVMAVIHFWFSAYGASRSVMRSLDASPPDPDDGIHKQLLNIIEEIRIVTGNRRGIDCMVIPSLAMNALAADDLKGDAIVAITEGLLSRLTRSQLEAVMAHEAYHILSGDCMETTVATSIFGMYASALEKLQNASQGRAFLLPAFLFAWGLFQLSHIFHMFISREREYRADAGSVRMTRNPLALTEALHLISRNWRGSGLISNSLEMLCIVNPEMSALDESEGWWADLVSTHPPIRKRIDILLKMARAKISELESRVVEKKETTETLEPSASLYFAFDPEQQWQGPYLLSEIAFLPWLSPLTWIRLLPGEEVKRAYEDPSISLLLTDRLRRKDARTSSFTCPKCKQPLITLPYKKTQVYQCDFCKGVLVESVKIPRIITRREMPCAERIKSLARAVNKENQMKLTRLKLKGLDKAKIPLYPCPKCKNPMLRRFYSLAYLVEIDRCSLCGLTWFDEDELEILQCMIENQIVAKI